jgi:hypothetical protein
MKNKSDLNRRIRRLHPRQLNLLIKLLVICGLCSPASRPAR